MLPLEHDRPLEIRSLLNPAFCSLGLREFVEGYVSVASDYPHLTMVFFVLPLILHLPTRAAMDRTNAATGLQTWLANHPEVRLAFAERVGQTAKYTKEALIFGTAAGALGVVEGRVTPGTIKQSRKVSWDNEDERKDILVKSRRLGKWFGRVADMQTIFIVFGVKL